MDGGTIALLFYDGSLQSFNIPQLFFTQVIEFRLIMGINPCNIGKHFVRENVFPVDGCGEVSPLQTELVYIGRLRVKQVFFMPELEKVIPRIKADIRTTFFRKDMGHLCIQVMKRIPQILLIPTTGVYNGKSRSREQVHPRTAQGHIKRSTVLHNRSFKLYSAF